MRGRRHCFVGVFTAIVLLTVACAGSESDNTSVSSSVDDIAAQSETTNQQPTAADREAPSNESTSTSDQPAVTTTVAETTTSTTPYLVFKRAGEAGGETSQLATASGESPVALYATVTPSRTGTLATVEWEGSYTHCIGAGPTASAFAIRIHPDAAGEPDLSTSLLDVEYPLADVEETFLPETSHPDCEEESAVPLYRYPFFSYEATIVDGPELTGDEPLWILVQAHLPDFTTFWNWRTSGLGRPPSRQLVGAEWRDSTLGASTVALTAVAE